jgi:hypothetical protein
MFAPGAHSCTFLAHGRGHFQISESFPPKAKGRILLREVAPAFRFFEDPVRIPGSQPIAILDLYATCEPKPAFPVPARYHNSVARAPLVPPSLRAVSWTPG